MIVPTLSDRKKDSETKTNHELLHLVYKGKNCIISRYVKKSMETLFYCRMLRIARTYSVRNRNVLRILISANKLWLKSVREKIFRDERRKQNMEDLIHTGHIKINRNSRDPT